MSTIKVLVNGASGRMGSLSAQHIDECSSLTLVAGIDQRHDLKEAIEQYQPDVVVDFTVASVGLLNASIIIEAGVRPVMGTTGFTEQEVLRLEQQCQEKQLGGIIAPNFSLGAVLLMQISKQVARYFPQAEVIEGHHLGKEEAPSGTAIHTAELIAQGRLTATDLQRCHEVIPHARGAFHEAVAIHSLRLPGVLAEQEVIFGGTGETLRIKHQTLDRGCFMPGVLLACHHVMTLDHLVYGLEHILLNVE